MDCYYTLTQLHITHPRCPIVHTTLGQEVLVACLTLKCYYLFVGRSKDTKIYSEIMGAWLTSQPLRVLLLNKLCSPAEPSQSNLYNSFQFLTRWGGWGRSRSEKSESTKSVLSCILAATCKNKLPGNNIKPAQRKSQKRVVADFKVQRNTFAHFGFKQKSSCRLVGG